MAIECPGCGDEAHAGDMVGDGDPLACGCAGAMSVDGESDPYVSHNDEDCIVCRDIEIAWLEDKVALIKGLEAERDAVDSICEADGRLNSDTQFVLAVRQTIRRAGTKG